MTPVHRRTLADVDDGRPRGVGPTRLPVRRRRPSGQRAAQSAPLPRSARWWIVAVAAAAVAVGLGLARLNPLYELDRAAADLILSRPDDGSATVARAVRSLGSTPTYRALWMPTVLVLVAVARWRHLAIYLTTLTAVAVTAQGLFGDASVPRAVRITLTGSAGGYVPPSWPVIVLATVATATAYVLLPGGRSRRIALTAVGALTVALSVARLRLGLDSLSGDLTGALLGSGIAALAFLLLAPEAEFPVTYRRHNPAHLDLDGERGRRIVAAARDQLGITLTDIRPYRLAGSAGSTPCRLRVAGPAGPYLFGKLYATSHLRSDRWYKFFRVLRYGRLEDEGPFASVRRLVEHEDYMLRLLRDSGVRVPRPHGVVEVLAGREYLFVTDLVPDAVEMLAAEVDDEVIDDALLQVRLMWDAGVAHRDVKPSNLLVRGRAVWLVDVAFGELRPSPWREAVDLANMMLTLALATDARQVYRRAVLRFDPEEIAEAFAATGSVTVPRQLRRLMSDSGQDLVGQFRHLAPWHSPIAVQRWSVRRVWLALATVGGIGGAAFLLAANLRAGELL